MRKIFFIFLLALVAVAGATAQTRTVRGVLIDRDTKEPIPYITVQLLKQDSTFVGGMTTKDDGTFAIQAPENGNFLVRFTEIGRASCRERVCMRV